MEYKISKIPKGNGQYRTIYIPSETLKKKLLGFIPKLNKILDELDTHNSNYAFRIGKNCALNAFQHIGRRFVLSMDLENFFDSVSVAHVQGLIPKDIIEACFINGNPKQGLPTSPAIATIAFLSCDKAIIEALKKLKIPATYTRYADDLIFSFDDISIRGKIQHLVRQVTANNNFRVNERKTKLQDLQNGRLVITGIATDSSGLHSTRRTKRKIRAAKHQGNHRSLQGLEEWSKCKLPKEIVT